MVQYETLKVEFGNLEDKWARWPSGWLCDLDSLSRGNGKSELVGYMGSNPRNKVAYHSILLLLLQVWHHRPPRPTIMICMQENGIVVTPKSSTNSPTFSNHPTDSPPPNPKYIYLSLINPTHAAASTWSYAHLTRSMPPLPWLLPVSGGSRSVETWLKHSGFFFMGFLYFFPLVVVWFSFSIYIFMSQ